MVVMARIAGQIVILACAAGVFWFVTLILNEDVPMPAWLPFDFQKDTWLAPLLRVFGALLLAPPVAALMVSIILLGYEPRGQNLYDGKGPIVLSLGPGARYGGAGLCLVLMCAIVAVLIWQNEPLGIWLFTSPILLACLYGVVLCFVVRATYDEDGISSIYYGLRWKQDKWSELTAVYDDPGPGDIVLQFGEKTQRVSAYYNGIGNLVQFANVKLNEAKLAEGPLIKARGN